MNVADTVRPGSVDRPRQVIEVPEPVVRLTSSLRRALLASSEHSVLVVLVSRPDTVLTPIAARWIEAAGALWVTRDDDGGLVAVGSGRRVATLADLDARLVATTPRFADDGDTDAESVEVTTFDVQTDHRADAGTLIGAVLGDVLAALGDEDEPRWGLDEPLERRWSLADLTEQARSGMPAAGPFHVATDRGSHAMLTLRRTRHGLRECVRGGVVHARSGSPQEAVDRAVATVEMLAGRGRAVRTAHLSRTRAAARGHHAARPSSTPHPLVAYLDASTIALLGADPGALAARHGGRAIGRARLPGLVVPFSTEAARAWRQMSAFAEDCLGGASS